MDVAELDGQVGTRLEAELFDTGQVKCRVPPSHVGLRAKRQSDSLRSELVKIVEREDAPHPIDGHEAAGHVPKPPRRSEEI